MGSVLQDVHNENLVADLLDVERGVANWQVGIGELSEGERDRTTQSAG